MEDYIFREFGDGIDEVETFSLALLFDMTLMIFPLVLSVWHKNMACTSLPHSTL